MRASGESISKVERLHNEAVRRAKNFRVSESELLSILIEVDAERVFEKKGYASLHTYCVKALGLTDSHAYALVGVARKSKQVPELKTLIDEGELHLSNARRLVSVITPENKKDWLDKGVSLSQRELEREIVKAHPEKLPKERIRPLTEAFCELKLAIPRDLEAQLKRVQDLLSQKMKKPVSLEAALRAMTAGFLEKHDPVKKAERNLCPGKTKPVTQGRRALFAQVKHEVHSRDGHRCTHRYPDGSRCDQSRWVQLHHLKPVSEGGKNHARKLVTLCYSHHRYLHHADQLRAVNSSTAPSGPHPCHVRRPD